MLMITHLAPTNQCILCKSVFASRGSAKNHVRASIIKDCCVADAAYLPVPVVVPKLPFECLLRGQECSTLDEYYEHLAQEIPVPKEIRSAQVDFAAPVTGADLPVSASNARGDPRSGRTDFGTAQAAQAAIVRRATAATS